MLNLCDKCQSFNFYNFLYNALKLLFSFTENIVSDWEQLTRSNHYSWHDPLQSAWDWDFWLNKIREYNAMAPSESKDSKYLSSKAKEEGKIIQKASRYFISQSNRK